MIAKTTRGKSFFLLVSGSPLYSFYVSTKVDDESKLPLLIHPLATDLEGHAVEDLLSRALARIRTHRIFNFETVKTLTMQGLGVGVLPTQVAKPLLQQNHLRSAQIAKTKHVFGAHSIGFLASETLLRDHREFAQDVYRLGVRWAKS